MNIKIGLKDRLQVGSYYNPLLLNFIESSEMHRAIDERLVVNWSLKYLADQFEYRTLKVLRKEFNSILLVVADEPGYPFIRVKMPHIMSWYLLRNGDEFKIEPAKIKFEYNKKTIMTGVIVGEPIEFIESFQAEEKYFMHHYKAPVFALGQLEDIFEVEDKLAEMKLNYRTMLYYKQKFMEKKNHWEIA